jgi:hypothetical protein
LFADGYAMAVAGGRPLCQEPTHGAVQPMDFGRVPGVEGVDEGKPVV